MLKHLYEIAEKYGLTIFYNNTAPNHGKYLHDSEGAVIKSYVFEGISANKIKWDSENFRYAGPVCDWLNDLFKRRKSKKNMKRIAIELPKEEVTHEKSTQKTLDGMNTNFCFLICGDRSVINWEKKFEGKCWYRKFSCFCTQCLNLKKCKYTQVVGKWKKHVFKKTKPRKN